MESTSASLLERLRSPTPGQSWTNFVQLYTPLLVRWTTSWKMTDADAEDLAQEVLLQVFRKLPQFDKAKGGFRGWLWTIAHNKRLEKIRQLAAKPAAGHLPSEVEDSDNVAYLAEAEDRSFLTRRCLELLKSEWDETRYQMFLAYVLDEQPAAAVAARFGVSKAVVFQTKSVILRQLREELAGLLD